MDEIQDEMKEPMEGTITSWRKRWVYDCLKDWMDERSIFNERLNE